MSGLSSPPKVRPFVSRHRLVIESLLWEQIFVRFLPEPFAPSQILLACIHPCSLITSFVMSQVLIQLLQPVVRLWDESSIQLTSKFSSNGSVEIDHVPNWTGDQLVDLDRIDVHDQAQQLSNSIKGYFPSTLLLRCLIVFSIHPPQVFWPHG